MAANLWRLLIACHHCGVLKCFEPAPLIDARMADVDFEEGFQRGKLKCDKCRTPAVWMKLEHVAPSHLSATELRVWTRPKPTSAAGFG
jgi:hypothetical protein